jgi:hypothetical protein
LLFRVQRFRLDGGPGVTPAASSQPARAQFALAHWRERLRGVVVPRLCSDADAAALGGEQVAPKRLLAHAEAEPGFALEVLGLANARLREGESPRGLAHALKLLGQSQLKTLLRMPGAPGFDPKAAGHRACLQAMATTRLGWLYLQGWLRHTLASDEDSRLAVLLVMDAWRWKLALVEPALMAALEARVAAGEPRARVERALLGCPPQALARAHLEDLGFAQVDAHARLLQLEPRLLARAARCGQRGDAEAAPSLGGALGQGLRERLLGCRWALALAHSTQADWYSARTESLVAIAACWLGRGRGPLLRGLQRQAVIASGESVFTQGLRAPAVGLLWPPRARRSDAGKSARSTSAESRSAGAQPTRATTSTHVSAPAARTMHASADAPRKPAPAPSAPQPKATAPQAQAPAPAPERAANPTETLQPFLRRCEHQTHADLRMLLAESVRALRAFGFARCALFLRQAGSPRCGLYFASGMDSSKAPRGLAIEPGEHGLLPRLLSQPGAAFWLQPSMLAGIASKLPVEFAGWPQAGGFALAAVASSGRNFGFWWADAGAADELDATRFAAFRKLAQAFGPEFARLLKAQRAQTATAASE